ncbi:MAG: NAD-dependent epimerase/dehydratase family protein, partial [Verrucomicrobia bacterium]|nr:NAD-dependent epimerase/dehydratase family protein [Verrucomicrobiota bacterium]
MKRSSKRSRFRALVTGGAGLIGSHIVDRLLTEECFVRVFDSLEPQTHPNGRPGWSRIAEDRGAEFVQGDVRDRSALAAALRDIDVVFHQAA